MRGTLYRFCAFFAIFLCSAVLVGCGSGSSSVSSPPVVRLSAEAASEDLPEELDLLLEELFSILPEGIATDGEELSEMVGVEKILGEILGALLGGSSELWRFFVMLFGITILFSITDILTRDRGELSVTASSGVNIALALPIFIALFGVIDTVRQGIESASEFFGGLIPIATAVLSFGGRVGTAAAQGTSMSLTLGVVGGFFADALMPLCALAFALSLVSSVNEDTVAPALGGVKKAFTFFLGAATTVILASVALQSAITSAQDSMAMRGMKYALSNMIPVVGNVVSGAVATLSGGVGYVASVVGAASVAAVGSIFILPLAELLIYRIAINLNVWFMDFAGVCSGKKTLSAFSSALDFLIAVFASSAIIYTVEIIIFMRWGMAAI